MAKVAAIGAGMMGTALCTPMADAGHDVFLVGTHLDRAWVEAMKKTRIHPKLGIALPDRVTPLYLEELEQAMKGAELVTIGVSSAGVRWAAQTIGPYLRPELPLLSVTKGLEETEPGTLRVLPDVFRSELPEAYRNSVFPGAIGGPCIAGELARKVPTCVVFTARDRRPMDKFAKAFSTPYYHIRVSTDVVGVEVCAALKNAYAMAVGMGAGVLEKQGGKTGPVAYHNYESAIFAQACLEMVRLIQALGGRTEQVPHLPGAGDMLVTCSGGRSSRLGRWLGLGLSFEEARAKMPGDTLESADTIKVVGGALGRMAERGLLQKGAMPLMEHLYEVIVEQKPLDMPFDKFYRD